MRTRTITITITTKMKIRSSCSKGEEHSNGNDSDCEKIDDKWFPVAGHDPNGFERDGDDIGCLS